LVATYAYINPVIALFLGWLILDETLNFQIALSAAVILAGVFIPDIASRLGIDQKESTL